MKRVIPITVIIVALLAFGLIAPAQADETVAFRAVANQSRFVSSDCEGGVCTLVAQGSGAVNIMGSMTYTFVLVQDFNTTPCSEASGVMTFVGATGTITLFDSGAVCPGSGAYGFPAVISSNWVITSGTGEFEGITGSGTSEGVIGGNGPVVHYSGTVSY